MVRASLLFRGAAVVLLCASAAAGQTSLSTADFSDDFLYPAQAETIWPTSFAPALPFADDYSDSFTSPILPVVGYETEMPPTLETNANTALPSLDSLTWFAASASKDANDSKDAKRIQPTPTAPSGSQGASSSNSVIVDPPSSIVGAPSGSCPGGSCGPFGCGQDNSFAAPMCPCVVPVLLPFACPQQPMCRRCCRKHRHCGGGYGNAYLAWPCGMQGCPNFCAPPPPCCGHKCHRRRGCQNNYGGYSGYGFGGGSYGMGGNMGWGGCGCQPCPVFFCSPCAQPAYGHKCHRRHGCHNNYGGYPGNICGGGYPGCGYGGYVDFYDCYRGGCGHRHRCGLFHRRHSCGYAPPPCPCYGFAMQPCGCMGMGGGMGMGMGMGMGGGMGMGMGAGMGMGMGMGMDAGMDMNMGMNVGGAGMGMGSCPSCSAGAAMQ